MKKFFVFMILAFSIAFIGVNRSYASTGATQPFNPKYTTLDNAYEAVNIPVVNRLYKANPYQVLVRHASYTILISSDSPVLLGRCNGPSSTYVLQFRVSTSTTCYAFQNGSNVFNETLTQNNTNGYGVTNNFIPQYIASSSSSGATWLLSELNIDQANDILLWSNHDIYYGSTKIYNMSAVPTPIPTPSPTPIPQAVVNLNKPTGTVETGLGLNLPYEFTLLNASYIGNITIGVDKVVMGSRQNVLEKSISFDISKITYSGNVNMNIEHFDYYFYVKFVYSNGTETKTAIAEKGFSGTIDETQLNGQDVTTGNDAYNHMVKLTSPYSGQLYDYGAAESYTISCDKSYFDSNTHLPLSQYLPPEPESTGYYQKDMINKQQMIMANIVLNGAYNDSLKFSLQELWDGDITKNFPWFANQGLISTGKNSLVIVSTLSSQNKTSFYNYQVNGLWRHAYAGVEFYIGDEQIGVVDPEIPVVGGSTVPVRSDYPDGILGAVEFGFDTLMTYVTFPFKLIGSGITFIVGVLGSALSSVESLAAPIAKFFGFLPAPVVNMISLALVSSVLITVFKMIRGQ